MTARHLPLSLQAAATVPFSLSWLIEDGCLRLAS